MRHLPRFVPSAPQHAASLLLILAAGTAQAQSVEIVYAPLAAAAVPGLLTLPLIALALVIGVLGYRFLRARGHGQVSALWLPAGLALMLASQVPLAREAVAAMLPAVPLTQATGGTATVIGAGTIPVTNATAVHLRLVSVAPNPATQLLPGTTCAAGAELAPGGQCVLALGCAPALATPSLARPRAQGWGC